MDQFSRLCCWCADLYGLLLFLGVDPYWVKFWWTKLLYEPFSSGQRQPLYAAVSQVLWRTAKDDVIDQVSQCCFVTSMSICKETVVKTTTVR